MSTAEEPAARVSTLELFFDLVFVFTITQLTAVLAHRPDGHGLGQVCLMLGVIWWMYGGYAWLTNAVAPDRASRRLLLLGGMASYLVLALTIPRAFAGGGIAFGLAYLCVVAVHAILYTRTSSATTVRAVLGIAPYNVASALLVLAGGIAGGGAQYAIWAAAVALEWTTPRLIDDSGFEVGAAHFVERHGLVVLVALGESVVAIGIGAAELPVDAELVAVAVVGLLLSACLWWTYFGGDDARAEEALRAAPQPRRPRLAVDAFGYWHMPILLGVVAIAAAERKATGHPFEPLVTGDAVALGAGAAVFLLGDVLFRRTLGIGTGRWRAGAAVLALATVPLGRSLAAFAQITALVVLFAVALSGERRLGARPRRAPRGRLARPVV